MMFSMKMICSRFTAELLENDNNLTSFFTVLLNRKRKKKQRFYSLKKLWIVFYVDEGTWSCGTPVQLQVAVMGLLRNLSVNARCLACENVQKNHRPFCFNIFLFTEIQVLSGFLLLLKRLFAPNSRFVQFSRLRAWPLLQLLTPQLYVFHLFHLQCTYTFLNIQAGVRSLIYS